MSNRITELERQVSRQQQTILKLTKELTNTNVMLLKLARRVRAIELKHNARG